MKGLWFAEGEEIGSWDHFIKWESFQGLWFAEEDEIGSWDHSRCVDADGALGGRSPAGAGGVIRNNKGVVLCTFIKHVGFGFY